MKKIHIFIFTLLLTSLQAFAQENVEKDSTNAKPEQTENVAKESEKKEENKVSLADRLKELEVKKIRIYEFNPVKNPKGFITIVEFNDLNCKECLAQAKEFYDVINKKDLENIKIIYKHINKDKTKLVNQNTVYGMVANRLNKFWEFKDDITVNDYKTNEDYINSMLSVGINKEELYNNLMLNSDRFYKNLDADEHFAISIKSHATPMFFIDGYRINEDITLQDLNEYIQLKTQEFMEAKAKEDNKYKMGKF